MSRKVAFTKHALDVIRERDILDEWVQDALTAPDRTEIGSSNNTHYIKAIPERGDRMLRVVVNENVEPNRVVTLFFDRRLRRK